MSPTKVEYLHIVVVAFSNEESKIELGVWGYRTSEDAQKRYERVMEMHHKYEANKRESPLLATETFIVGVYDDFEQSLFVETAPGEVKEN